MPDLTDEERLLEGLLANEHDAQQRFVRQYAGAMVRLASRVLGDRDEAHDVVQDAFANAFKALDRFEGRSSLYSWLRRIVVNEALSRRRAKRHPTVSLDELEPVFDAASCRIEPMGAIVPTETLVAREEVRVHVRESIEKLPDSYREIVLLRDIEGFDTAETADLLGISDALVKTRLHRARAALKILLESVLRP